MCRTTPQQLLDHIGSASSFQDLSLRADIALEKLLQAALRAEIENAIPGIDEPNVYLLEGLDIGSISALQSLPVEDSNLMNMLYNEFRLEWIA